MCRLRAFITALCLFICLLATVLFVVIIIPMLIFIAVHEMRVKVTIEDASLSRFDMHPSLGVLYFNLDVGIRVHNPNKVDLYSNHVASALYYNGYNLGHTWVAPSVIVLHRNDTTILTAAFVGRASYHNEFGSSSSPTGISYSLDLWISYHFRPNSIKWYTSEPQDMLRCRMDLRVITNETLKTKTSSHFCDSISGKYWPADLPFD